MTNTIIAPTTACTFTLASALAWAGHDCSGGCPPSAAQTPASLWFLRRSAEGSWGRRTLVVIDLGDSCAPLAEIRALLREVGRCARRDHIQVRERMATDQGRALAALSEPPAKTGAALYLRPTGPAMNPMRPRRPQEEGLHGARRLGRGSSADVADRHGQQALQSGASPCGG